MYNFLEQTEKKVICCQIKHPIPVIGTLRADFSRFVFSFCREETHFKMAYQVFALKRNFRPSKVIRYNRYATYRSERKRFAPHCLIFSFTCISLCLLQIASVTGVGTEFKQFQGSSFNLENFIAN